MCCNNTCSCSCRCNRNCCRFLPSCGRYNPAPIIVQGQTTQNKSQIASFTATAAQTVAVGSAIPLTLDYNLDTTDISFTTGGSTVTVNTSGFYLIGFDANATDADSATVTADDLLGISVALNGTEVSKSQSSASIDATGDTVSLASRIILYVPAGSTLSLLNTGAIETEYSNVNFIIQKLNA